jgi:hypothetical protein
MAEYEFGITDVIASLKEQSVFIYFTLDLDEETVNPDNIILTVRNIDTGKNDIALYDISVFNNIIQLKLNEWAVPNVRYTLIIQPGTKSITGELLNGALIRNFSFKSDVTSKVNLLTPADFEKIPYKDFTCTWEEIGNSLTHNFYLEICKNQAFFNLVLKTSVFGKRSFTTNELEPGQYFIRIRAQQDDEYGYWSPLKTFIVDDNKSEDVDSSESNPNDDENTNNDDDGPIIIEDDNTNDLIIVSTSENGITPLSFEITFNEDIDISEAKIEVIRSDF